MLVASRDARLRPIGGAGLRQLGGAREGGAGAVSRFSGSPETAPEGTNGWDGASLISGICVIVA